jgi:CubicO group peptidase (beta-lactamase class C family)
MGTATEVHGTFDPGFESVADAFAANFDEHDEVGAAVCVYHRGRPVLDLWGGLADREAGRPWQRDTLQLVFSTTKGVAASPNAVSWISRHPSPGTGPSSPPRARATSRCDG